MQPELIQQYLQQEPFQPFRIHLRDGRAYDVRYPRVCRVTRTAFIIGTPLLDPRYPDVAGQREYVSPEEIINVEFIPVTLSTSS
jgi:hypothetical protein